MYITKACNLYIGEIYVKFGIQWFKISYYIIRTFSCQYHYFLTSFYYFHDTDILLFILLFPVLNNSVMKIFMHKALRTPQFISLGMIPRNGITRLNKLVMFKALAFSKLSPGGVLQFAERHQSTCLATPVWREHQCYH